MSRFRRWRAIVTMVTALAASAAHAQQNQPSIGYVYPAGGRQGTQFQVVVGGQFLTGVSGAVVSGQGVHATLIEHVRPLTPREMNLLRDRLKVLMEKRLAATGRASSTRPAWTTDDEKEVAEIRKKLATFVRRPSSLAIAEKATLQVSIAPDAAPGRRELRLRTPLGLTGPLVFCVGSVAEVNETEPRAGQSAPEATVTLPVVVNGQIMPGDVDRFRFEGKEGQRVVVAVSARQLIPYLADAVPGWFQATVALYDSTGAEVAYADDFRFDPDPVLYYQIPRDGQYTVEIKDSIYRGREDFVYRVSIGPLPFITGVFPLGGRAGQRTTVQVNGWNLPTSTLTPATDQPGVHPLSLRSGRWLSNEVPFAVDELPECLEREPNNSPANAQTITLPMIVNGRIDAPDDVDVFRIDARAGERIVAEVNARRLNSPVDSVLRLMDASGRQIALNDDCPDQGSGLLTHHADSRLLLTVPAAGTYYVHLGDVQRKGGTEYAYRLRLDAPRPDFELRVTPATINARAGSTVPLTVHALRKDGFAGPITLRLKDAPAGFALGGAAVPEKQDQVRITLTVPPQVRGEPVSLQIEGRAEVDGRQLTRGAVPAENRMQAFAYWHLVPVSELKVLVAGRGAGRSLARITSPVPVRIPAGGTARVRVEAPPRPLMGAFSYELDEPPAGVSIRSVTPLRGGAEIVLQADAGKAAPGLKGNLIIHVQAERPAARAATAPANRRRAPLGTLPAVPFEIVPQ